uniref:Complement C3d receptor 2 n=1 Tax=Panthera tigris altaica TaxID=74533 RepID=A0A8C9K271_PANTA
NSSCDEGNHLPATSCDLQWETHQEFLKCSIWHHSHLHMQ